MVFGGENEATTNQLTEPSLSAALPSFASHSAILFETRSSNAASSIRGLHAVGAALSLLPGYLCQAFPRTSLVASRKESVLLRRRKEGDVGPSPQLRRNKQNTHRSTKVVASTKAS
jgi:hypothetical protein